MGEFFIRDAHSGIRYLKACPRAVLIESKADGAVLRRVPDGIIYQVPQ